MDFLLKVRNFFSGMKTEDIQEILREKRFSPRISCDVQATCMSPGHDDATIIITEIGLFGVRIHIGRMLRTGEEIRIAAIKGIGILSGARYATDVIKMKVLWCKKRKTARDYMAGLRYNDTKKSLRDSWVSYLLKKFGIAVGVSSQKRKKVRIPSHLPLVYSTGSDEKTGNVIDIGLGGMLISSENKIPEQEYVQFRVGPYKTLGEFVFQGKVVHHRFVHSTGKWVAGIIFSRMSEVQDKLLSSYLSVVLQETR